MLFNDVCQKRKFLLSSFIRMKSEITINIYEFCDYIIREDIQLPLSDLDEVDRQIKTLYTEFANKTNWDDRV